MVILEVYSKCLKVKYKARLCSKATIFTLLTNLIAIVIPFVFAYNSRGFWIKHDTFYEQPDVKFRGEYLFSAITSNLSLPIICSSFPYFKDFQNLDKCSLVKAREIDNNRDSKVDELEFSFTIDKQFLKILSFSIILAFDYNLHTVCPAVMQSAAIIQYNFHSSTISEINIIANMDLTQTTPLRCHSKLKNRQYNYSLLQNKYGSHSYDIGSILMNYSKRNISTHLTNKYITFETGTTSELSVKLKISFPEHKVNYVPSFWQVIKWAWMQYLATYIIFAWVMQKIKSYIFENRLVLFYETSPLKITS